MSSVPSSNKSASLASSRPWLALALLLGASHVAVFFIARGTLAAAGAAPAVVDAPAAKVRERERTGSRVPGGSREEIAARFTGMLHELERAGLPDDEFYKLRQELFREWIRRDLRSALDLMASPLTVKRYGEMIDELDKELRQGIARQPRESWDWILTRRYGTITPKVADLWLQAVMEDRQVDLALELLPAAPVFAQDDFAYKISGQANAAQLAKVRAFLTSPQAQKMEQIDYPIRCYAERMAKIHAADGEIAPLLAAESDARIRGALAEEWASRELNHLPVADAVRRALALPPELRGPVLEVLAGHERQDPMAPLDVLDSMAAHGALAGLGKDQIDIITQQVVESVTDGESLPLADSFAAVQRLGNAELRRAAYEAMGVRYEYESWFPALLESLPQLPAGPDRDAMLASAIRKANETDEHLPALIAALSDRELAAQLEREKEEERVQSDSDQ